MKKLGSRFYGQAGEYYAAFRLWGRNHGSVGPSWCSRWVDLLLYDADYKLLATVQVKTRSTKNQEGWLISRKQVGYLTKNIFYIFVELDLHPKGIPTSYVVPSIIVAELARQIINNEPKIGIILDKILGWRLVEVF